VLKLLNETSVEDYAIAAGFLMGRLDGRAAGFLVGFLVGFGLTGAFVTGALVGLGEGFGFGGVATGDVVGGGVRVGRGIGSIVLDPGKKYGVGDGVFVGRTRGGPVFGMGIL
jgi:hypothetical protein